MLGPTGGSVVRVLQSSPYADAAADPDTVDELAVFAAYEGIEDHATARRRRVAGGRRDAGRGGDLGSPRPPCSGVGTGDVLRLRSRLDTSRAVDVAGQRHLGGPTPPTSGGWPTRSRSPGAESSGSFTTRGPLVVAAEDLVAGAARRAAQRRVAGDPAASTASRPRSIAAVEALATGIEGRVNAALPFSNQAQVLTRLPTILATVDRSVLVTQAGHPAAARPVRRARRLRGHPRRGAAPRAAADRDGAPAGPRRRVRAPRVDGAWARRCW